ncbi:wd containing protein [Fusarium beomiforme]|uniref:Wd containing protein n=1 Tax=Fusarium beomiforme TaxID=44412 RepID=A0A9P5AI57_9HYPO|nr:wd containing protein [Fusarium beomiforme]
MYPTDALVTKHARKHYRIPVRSQHWQLRSLVSAEKQNIVYFPGGNGSNHVQRLNTTTRECETIKLLTFAPRCLVAEKGWLCCGSESGDFVAIRLDEGNDDDHGILSELDSDTRLSLGLDSSRDDSILSLLSRARRNNKSLIAKSMKLAKDRVNCITLWFPPTTMPVHDRAYTEPVAVLANNDRTVTLVSLHDFDRKEKTEALDVITYPDFVNRALISPDGRLLIAILDDPYLYIHERVKKVTESPVTRFSESPAYQWEQTQRILLKSQKKDDRTDSRGSFAACFSESGAYLAVGTQHGTISIFNAALLTNPDADPLITTFPSSRPHSGPGAIRDMAFCPGPFGMLAWTEDRGNVGIADMRSNFYVRQIVSIEEPVFEHINILDRNTIDPRLLESRRERRDAALGSGSTETARRRGDVLETLNTPLTANETLVLEAMQIGRRSRERAAQRAAAAAEDRPTGGPTNFWAARAARRTIANDDNERPMARRSSSIGRAMGDLLGSNYRRTPGQRPVTRDPYDSPPEIARRPDRLMESLGETVAMLREQRQRQDNSYLTVLEILQARERDNDRDQDDTTIIVPLVNQVVNRWEDDHGVFEVPPSPDNTAGLAWSEDGRTLFVGAQNGIYELHVDTQMDANLCAGAGGF